MSRRCVCARLLAALREDPRLLTLPLAARAFFLLVADASTRAPEPGLVPFVEPRRFALLVSCTETEAETQIETLETEGLLRREAGGLAVPLVRYAATRSDVARRNGAAGGRPRKGETRETYLQRRQAAMLLPLPATPTGDHAAKPEETQPPEPPARATTTTSLPVSSVGGGSAPPADARAPEWVSLGMELAETIGLDGARGGYDFRPVQVWLAAGIHPETIRAVIGQVADRPGFRAASVRTFRYFDQAVQQAHAAEPVPAKAMTAEDRARDRRETAEIDAWSIAVAQGRDVPRPACLPPRRSAA